MGKKREGKGNERKMDPSFSHKPPDIAFRYVCNNVTSFFLIAVVSLCILCTDIWRLLPLSTPQSGQKVRPSRHSSRPATQRRSRGILLFAFL